MYEKSLKEMLFLQIVKEKKKTENAIIEERAAKESAGICQI